MNYDEAVADAAEVVTAELLEDFTHSDATVNEAAPAIARAVLDVARDAGWQPAPTVGPDVDNIARTISQAVGGYNKDATTIRNAARAVADADPRRTEAEVKAEALEEAADNVRRSDWYTSWKVDNYAGTIQHWLRARAARLRKGQQ